MGYFPSLDLDTWRHGLSQIIVNIFHRKPPIQYISSVVEESGRWTCCQINQTMNINVICTYIQLHINYLLTLKMENMSITEFC